MSTSVVRLDTDDDSTADVAIISCPQTAAAAADRRPACVRRGSWDDPGEDRRLAEEQEQPETATASSSNNNNPVATGTTMTAAAAAATTAAKCHRYYSLQFADHHSLGLTPSAAVVFRGRRVRVYEAHGEQFLLEEHEIIGLSREDRANHLRCRIDEKDFILFS